MSSNSSSRERPRILAAHELRELLEDVANFSGDFANAVRFMRKLKGRVPGVRGPLSIDDLNSAATTTDLDDIRAAYGIPLNVDASGFVTAVNKHSCWQLLELRDALRSVWKEQDLTLRRWGVIAIAQLRLPNSKPSWAFSRPGRAKGCPIPTPFEQALAYLMRPDVRTSICANPQCRHTPYFFADKLGQKFCYEPCAAPAQRESKRRWWAKNGRAWREKRQRARPRNKRRK